MSQCFYCTEYDNIQFSFEIHTHMHTCTQMHTHTGTHTLYIFMNRFKHAILAHALSLPLLFMQSPLGHTLVIFTMSFCIQHFILKSLNLLCILFLMLSFILTSLKVLTGVFLTLISLILSSSFPQYLFSFHDVILLSLWFCTAVLRSAHHSSLSQLKKPSD